MPAAVFAFKLRAAGIKAFAAVSAAAAFQRGEQTHAAVRIAQRAVNKSFRFQSGH